MFIAGASRGIGQATAVAFAEAGAAAVYLTARTEAALEELNTALYKWMARSPTPPKSYEELVSSEFYGKPAPAAPPGKKYAIDRKELKVVLVDQ